MRGNAHGAALARSRQGDQARNLFNPVYGWFTEGFNTSARLDSPKRSLTPIPVQT